MDEAIVAILSPKMPFESCHSLRLAARAFRLLLLAFLPVWASASAYAHAPSDTFLSLKLSSTNLAGHWQISARDLQHALGLDQTGAESLSAPELRLREQALALDTLSRLKLWLDQVPAVLSVTDEETVARPDGEALVYRFESPTWTRQPSRLDVSATPFLDLDPALRCILRVDSWAAPFETILNASRPS